MPALVRLLQKLKTDPFVLLLILVIGVLIFRNFTPDTWLTGWDTLHPEFNYTLNLKRMFSGVWREDQGFGALAAHSHMSELPRILFMATLDVFLPTSSVRYATIFICLLLGPLGVYIFCRQVVFAHDPPLQRSAAAGLAAMAYLLNLGTVQHFYVVFEMFAVQYAALAWLFWLATEYIRTSTKSVRTIFLFALATFLAAPMAYASTLWFAYAGCLALYVFFLSVGKKIGPWQRANTLLILTVLINSFWLFPNLYFLVSGGSETIQDSQINQLFSTEAFLHNQAYGDWKDIPLLKNFLFNWLEYSPDIGFRPLLHVWHAHLGSLPVRVIGYVVFFISLIGIVKAILSRSRWVWGILSIWLVTLFMLINENPPTGWLFNWLRSQFSLFEEGFRFPFTKFSILYMFCFAIFVGLGMRAMSKLLGITHRIFSFWQTTWVVSLFAMVMLIVFSWPMFNGQLVSPKLRKDIPPAYFELFQWLRSQPPSAKVALLPIHTGAGWQYHNWGYEGPGFIWFNTQQPIITRDFDRWSIVNETFYHQLSTALYKQDAEELKNTVTQYHTPYFLVDESNITPSEDSTALQYQAHQQLLEEIGYQKIWEKDFLRVYSLPQLVQSEFSAPSDFLYVSGETHYTRRDVIYQPDVASISKIDPAAVHYPFSFLQSDRSTSISKEDATIQANFITIENQLKTLPENAQLVIPEITKGQDFFTLAEITLNQSLLTISFYQNTQIEIGDQQFKLPFLEPVTIDLEEVYPSVYLLVAGQRLEVSQSLPVIETLSLKFGEPVALQVFNRAISGTIELDQAFASRPVETCWKKEGATQLASIQNFGDRVSITSLNTATCHSIQLPNLETNTPVLLGINFQYQITKNSTPQLCVVSQKNNFQCVNSYKLSQISIGKHQETQLIRLDPNDNYWLDIKTIPLEDDIDQRISYQIPQLTLHENIFETTLSDSIWQKLAQPLTYQINSTTNPTLSLRYLTQKMPIHIGESQAFSNCDISKRGAFSKNNSTDGVTYFAQGLAAACDGLIPSEINQSESYLMEIESQNTMGRGLKLYLTNLANNRLDLEKLLSSESERYVFPILNWPKLQKNGYSLNIETRSFGDQPSQNIIKNINFYPFPINWASEITIVSSNSQPLRNSLSILSQRKTASFWYQTEVTHSGTGLFSLSQSYDQGWIAFPGWRFWDRYEHVKYNGWANGWLIEEGAGSVTTDPDGASGQPESAPDNEQPITVTILYWPQLLSFVGYGLLVGTLGAFAIVFVRQSRQKKTHPFSHLPEEYR